MKKLFIAVMLLAASSANAGLLTGQTPANYSIPSGWSLVATQDFESGSLPATEGLAGSTAEFTTVQKHSGTRAMRGRFAWDGASSKWYDKKDDVGSFDEIYVSAWEYYDANARFNDELHTIRFSKRNADGTEAMQVVFDIYGGFNYMNGGVWFINEGIGEGYGGYWKSYYGPTLVWGQGTWVQWELHFKPNTYSGTTTRTPNLDGFMRVYQNGTLRYEVKNAAFNGKTDFRNGGVVVEVGGLYTKHIWYMDEPTRSVCSTSYGSGTGYARETNWSNPCACPNQCPPTGYVPIFYRYYDDIIVMKLTGAGGGADVQPPYVTTQSPSAGATGVPTTNRVISFHVKDDRTDDDGITQSTISLSVEGTSYTCSTGLSCSGSASDYAVSRTMGSDWTNGQVVDLIAAATDAAGNVMSQAWSFTAATTPDPLAITTTTLGGGTASTAYPSATLAATGGTTPYTWLYVSGTMPPGLVLSSGGVISGTPTTAGTFNFTARVTDASSTTDDQALTLIIAPAQPPTEISITFEDTWINSGSAATNYSDNTGLYVYQWPEYVSVNKALIFDNTDIQSIPDNVMVTSAKLRVWMYGYSGSGGSNPMRIYARSISGTLPTMEAVTWNNFAGTTTQLSYTDVGTTVGWYEFNVTNAVQTAYSANAPVYLMLDGGTEGVADSNRRFASYEYSDEALRPQLIVTRQPLSGPGEPTISAPGKLRVSKLRGTFR